MYIKLFKCSTSEFVMQKGLTTNVKTCSNAFFKKKALVGDFSKYWTTSSNISKHPLHVWFRVTYVWYHLRLVLPPLSRGYCSGWERERLQHCSCSGVTNPADWDLHLITSPSPSCIQPPSTDQHLLLHKLVTCTA